MPKVSIGLPVYNGEKLIARAIEALLAQDYKDFELIIADNRSTDRTAEICRSYAQKDNRVRYFLNDTNIGAAKNHNRVFELSSGEYFKWAAHDDECFPSMIGSCVRTMDAAPSDVVLVYPQSVIIDESGRVTGEYRRSIASQDASPHRRLTTVLKNVELGTPMYGIMRTSALRRTRLIDGFHSSDFVLFGELAMLGKIVELPELLFKKRFHPGRSFEAHKSMGAYLRWLNPMGKGRPSLFAHKLPFEYLRSIWRLPLTWRDRVLCTVFTLGVYYRRYNEPRYYRWKNRLLRVVGMASTNRHRTEPQAEPTTS